MSNCTAMIRPQLLYALGITGLPIHQHASIELANLAGDWALGKDELI